MKKKVRRFQEGGFTKEQEEFLGGADRTDPYILARMRSKFPDAPKTQKAETKVDAGEVRDETGEKSKMRRNTETGELYSTEASFKPTVKATPVAEAKKPVAETNKPVAVKKETTEMVVEKEEPKKKASTTVPKDFGKVTLAKSFTASGGSTEPKKSTAKLPQVDLSLPDTLARFRKQKNSDPAYSEAGYKKGGKVSSASRRADGIAIRGKTRA
jgi:hypothetical protein